MDFIKNIKDGLIYQLDKLSLKNKLLYYLGIILLVYGGLKISLDLLISILVSLGIIAANTLGPIGILINLYLGIRFVPGLIVGIISMIIVIGSGYFGFKYWNRFDKYRTLEFWAKALIYLFVAYTLVNIFNILGQNFNMFWYLIKLIVVILYYYFANRMRKINEIR